MLEAYLKRQPGGRLQPFPALHLLHALAQGIAPIHVIREYHGDLHTGNVMIRRVGLEFDVKIFDFFHWAMPRPENIRAALAFAEYPLTVSPANIQCAAKAGKDSFSSLIYFCTDSAKNL